MKSSKSGKVEEKINDNDNSRPNVTMVRVKNRKFDLLPDAPAAASSTSLAAEAAGV